MTTKPTSPIELILYTGPHCELCDHAIAIYEELDPVHVSLKKINIRTDVHLYHLYGARIPVLKRNDNKQELGWPFDATALEQFLL